MNEKMEIMADNYRELMLDEWYADWCKRHNVCQVHGGTEWRGGYCNLWATCPSPGLGPCIKPH